MNAAQLFGLDDEPESEPESESSTTPGIMLNCVHVRKLRECVEKMHDTSREEQKLFLTQGHSLHQIGYVKGKSQALHEVLELIDTGKIPEEAQ